MKCMVAAIIVVMLTNPAGAQKPPTLESQIKNELLNKTFAAKIALGNVLSTTATSRAPAQNRLVDTSVFPGGRVLFNVRDSLFFAPPGNVSVTCGPNQQGLGWTGEFLEGRLCRVKPGGTVRVDRLDINDDRLEVWLSLVPEGSYAKLKFMFGKGWQKTMNIEAVMEGVSAGLLIEAIEHTRTIAREYGDLRQRLQALLPPAPSDSLDKRLDQARTLRDVLNALVKNRTEYEKLGKESAAQETSGYAGRVRDLDIQIPALEAEIKKNALDKLRVDLSGNESEAAGLRTRLGNQPPKTLAELKAMEDLLSQWDINLRHRDDIEQMLRPLGESLTAAQVASRDREREEIRKRRTDLATSQPKLELADLNAGYARMKTEENRLKAAYVAAFDTPRQRDAATQFRNHLQTMIANREAAQRLGETSLAAEIQRVRSQLAAIR
jgi:hypothetical protein